MTEEAVKRGPGRPPKQQTPEPETRVTALQQRVGSLEAELEEVRRVAAAESAGVADLVAALKRAHSLFFELRVTAGLGFTTNKLVDSFLADTGHLIGRE